ncbi:type I-D CRISPR-associated helicase Cas3' [Geitlerinema sp. P-1104]|uniref:type I-D CRISPR-associated helicase Cas3' n=1 Tax=Geitlerinema sp. P-1104 TaxID=2546230 RepID=UPI0014769BBA|nr:type I-D CRISPR-associated helicase Cas3' [Geitlerinema sp. P-1104]NMG60308.1 type I-D CRISPR-associated helicase Cas3' [Geitlerinema sp. P-1104]
MKPLNLTLEPADIAVGNDVGLPAGLKRVFGSTILQHQRALYEAAKTHDVLIDLAPTGTGKTKAGLSVICENPQGNAVYIAPTNALIDQQTAAAEAFVAAAGLPHVVKAASARQIQSWRSDRVGGRSGEKLYNVLREPSILFPECGGGRPLLLVTNPDIFYYAAFFQYNALDRSNLASVFYRSFATVIFDEFHLYDAKQLVSLLFYLVVSQVFGYFQNNRKVVLLTATPEPACDEALKVLEQSGVRIHRVDGRATVGSVTPSQTAVALQIRPYLEKEEMIQTLVEQVCDRRQQFPKQQGAVILDSKDTLNRINDGLQARGYQDDCGRITGNTPKDKRHDAAQKPVILATSTVDVGFNFEREVEGDRQNLDWLIFSARDRFSFWQRLGRVGRVLGKPETQIPSQAIAYLPEAAWQDGLNESDGITGREQLAETLEQLDCLRRPFLDVYWRSEAFLEIARPLLELETSLEKTPGADLIVVLYETLQWVLGGNRDWQYYRQRMKILQGAENIAQKKTCKLAKDWKYIKGGRNLVKSFIQAYYPEDWEEVQRGDQSLEALESDILGSAKVLQKLKEYAIVLNISYAPLFRFRDSILPNVTIEDPRGYLLDSCGETSLDPLHLLRFYEFASEGDRIVVTERACQTYQLRFRLQVENLEEFSNTQLAKLSAFPNCEITRMIGDDIRPTALLSQLTPPLMPGVIVKEHRRNRWAICKLQKQGLASYPITVQDAWGESATYCFFPSLDGILAIASAGFALKCPDNEEFWCI